MDFKCLACGQKTFSFSINNEKESSVVLKFVCPGCAKTNEIYISSWGEEIVISLAS